MHREGFPLQVYGALARFGPVHQHRFVTIATSYVSELFHLPQMNVHIIFITIILSGYVKKIQIAICKLAYLST
jgi:hypothetical protein